MNDTKISEAKKAYARTETRLAVVGEIVRLFEKLEKDRVINQTRLAERLGISRSRVSKLLTGSDNWTLDTVADLLAGMDARLTRVEAKPVSNLARANIRHDWLEPKFVDPVVSKQFPSSNAAFDGGQWGVKSLIPNIKYEVASS